MAYSRPREREEDRTQQRATHVATAIRESKHLLIALLVWALAGLGVALLDLGVADGSPRASATAPPVIRSVPDTTQPYCRGSIRPC